VLLHFNESDIVHHRTCALASFRLFLAIDGPCNVHRRRVELSAHTKSWQRPRLEDGGKPITVALPGIDINFSILNLTAYSLTKLDFLMHVSSSSR
jgi:hypothetical protein